MSVQKSKPAPLETDLGEQRDDNIDDLGRRPDGSMEEQPVDPGPGHAQRNSRDRRSRSDPAAEE